MRVWGGVAVALAVAAGTVEGFSSHAFSSPSVMSQQAIGFSGGTSHFGSVGCAAIPRGVGRRLGGAEKKKAWDIEGAGPARMGGCRVGSSRRGIALTMQRRDGSSSQAERIAAKLREGVTGIGGVRKGSGSGLEATANEGNLGGGGGGGEREGLWYTRLTVLFVAFLYGTNFGCVKLLGENMSVSLAAAARFTLAAVCLSPFLGQLRKEVVGVGLEVGFWVTLGYVVQAIGLETVEASKAAFLCALIVVVCPVLEALDGGRVTVAQWSSVALAVLGAAFLELGGNISPGQGDIFALIQPIGFGVALWKCEKTQLLYPDQGGALTAIQLVCTMVASWMWVLGDYKGLPPTEEIVTAAANMEVAVAVLWTGFITTALTVYLQTTSVSKLSSAEATVFISTEPIWGAAFASILLGEQIGPNAFVGGGLIVLACLTSVVDPDTIEGINSTILKGAVATAALIPGGEEAFRRLSDFMNWTSQ